VFVPVEVRQRRPEGRDFGPVRDRLLERVARLAMLGLRVLALIGTTSTSCYCEAANPGWQSKPGSARGTPTAASYLRGLHEPARRIVPVGGNSRRVSA
jgi:hypothetical protein